VNHIQHGFSEITPLLPNIQVTTDFVDPVFRVAKGLLTKLKWTASSYRVYNTIQLKTFEIDGASLTEGDRHYGWQSNRNTTTRCDKMDFVSGLIEGQIHYYGLSTFATPTFIDSVDSIILEILYNV
jgi:hypothetical protein